MSESEDEVFVPSQLVRFADIARPVLPSPSAVVPSSSSRAAAVHPIVAPISVANSAVQSQLERVKSLVGTPDHRGVLLSMQSARDALQHLQVLLLCILFSLFRAGLISVIFTPLLYYRAVSP